MNSIETMMGDLIDLLAADPRAKIDPRCWSGLLIYSPKCSLCKQPTTWACADCGIENGGEKTVYVCPHCRDQHELLNPQHPKSK